MSTASELIRRIDFFHQLNDRLIDSIARRCITREYNLGDYIVRQGDPGLGLYIITRGSARVEIARDGVTTPVAELHAGEFVGELSIIDHKPRSANVVCTTETSCLLLTRDSFTKLVNKHPEIALQMAIALAARLRSTDDRLLKGAVVIPQPQRDGFDPHGSQTPTETQRRSDTQRVKDMLADTVSWVYLLKSVTQFSLAVVGCPVSVNLETRASRSLVSTIGPLKMVLIPSSETHLIGLHAFDDGAFKATILQPVITPAFTGVSISRFCAPVRRNESTWLRVPMFEKPHIEADAKLSGFAQIGRGISVHGGLRDLEASLDI